MDLGIVIVNWNVRDLLAACLDSIYVDLAPGHLRARVCVVDNGSTDGSAEMVRRQFPRTLLIESENRGMGAGNNSGLEALGFSHQRSAVSYQPPLQPRERSEAGAASPQLPAISGQQPTPYAALILNPDTVIRPGALRQLVEFLRAHPHAAIAAPKLLNPDGTLQHSGFRFPGLRQAALDLFPPRGRLARLIDSPWNGRYPAAWYAAGTPFQVDHTLGAAFAVRADAIASLGGELFDETFYMYCEEIDAQWRLARLGWERWVVPGAEVVHLGGRSTAQVASQSFVHLWTSRRRLYRRYHGPVINALVAGLVLVAMRRRIRHNHRLSQRGRLAPNSRAELNQMLNDVISVWQSRRLSVKRQA